MALRSLNHNLNFVSVILSAAKDLVESLAKSDREILRYAQDDTTD